MKDIVGYEAGRGKTFTPTVGATWINDFLQMMKDSKKSRNEVTEILIKEALDARKGLGSNVESLNLSPRELEFLMTPVGRKIISDYSQAYYGLDVYQVTDHSMLGEQHALTQDASNVVEKNNETEVVKGNISTEEKAYPEAIQPKETIAVNQKLSDQEVIKLKIKKELESISLKRSNASE
jgi:hypothetical protein